MISQLKYFAFSLFILIIASIYYTNSHLKPGYNSVCINEHHIREVTISPPTADLKIIERGDCQQDDEVGLVYSGKKDIYLNEFYFENKRIYPTRCSNLLDVFKEEGFAYCVFGDKDPTEHTSELILRSDQLDPKGIKLPTGRQLFFYLDQNSSLEVPFTTKTFKFAGPEITIEGEIVPYNRQAESKNSLIIAVVILLIQIVLAIFILITYDIVKKTINKLKN